MSIIETSKQLTKVKIMKTVTVNKAFAEILESIDDKNLINSYFGGSNITASYLNALAADGIDEFIGNWLDENLNKEWTQDIELTASNIIYDPDCILRYAGHNFFTSLCALFPNTKPDDAEKIFKNSYKFFNAYGNFYIFADNWSNACTNWYIIRATDCSEALSDLICKYECHFLIEDNKDVDTGSHINDNGNHVNIDNLQLIGCIKTSE